MSRARNYAEALRLAEAAADRATARRAELVAAETERRERLIQAGRPRWYRPWWVDRMPLVLDIDIWADLACGNDSQWRAAVASNQWYMQQAIMYQARDTPTWV